MIARGFIITVFFLTSCSTADVVLNEEQLNYTATEWETLGQGFLYGAGQEGIEESNHIIRDVEEWSMLKHQMDSINSVTPNFKYKEVDFETYMLVACFDKVRSNGGYTMKIRDVLESESTLKVFLERKTPEGMSTSLMVQPFHIVMVPKSTKELLFEQLIFQ